MTRNRVIQWAAMSRTWWYYDANHQCPFRSAELLCMYLEGRHKPIFHPLSDVGDHVIVANTQHISMADDLWRKQQYKHDSNYPKGRTSATAWKVHEFDPTMVLRKAVYSAGPKNLLRHNMMLRLHLFPGTAPKDIMENATGVIQQIQPIPKSLEQYTEDEIRDFPKLFDWPDDHEIFTHKTPEYQAALDKENKEREEKKKSMAKT